MRGLKNFLKRNKQKFFRSSLAIFFAGLLPVFFCFTVSASGYRSFAFDPLEVNSSTPTNNLPNISGVNFVFPYNIPENTFNFVCYKDVSSLFSNGVTYTVFPFAYFLMYNYGNFNFSNSNWVNSLYNCCKDVSITNGIYLNEYMTNGIQFNNNFDNNIYSKSFPTYCTCEVANCYSFTYDSRFINYYFSANNFNWNPSLFSPLVSSVQIDFNNFTSAFKLYFLEGNFVDYSSQLLDIISELRSIHATDEEISLKLNDLAEVITLLEANNVKQEQIYQLLNDLKYTVVNIDNKLADIKSTLQMFKVQEQSNDQRAYDQSSSQHQELMDWLRNPEASQVQSQAADIQQRYENLTSQEQEFTSRGFHAFQELVQIPFPDHVGSTNIGRLLDVVVAPFGGIVAGLVGLSILRRLLF